MTLKSLIISLFASFSKPIREKDDEAAEYEEKIQGWLIQLSDRREIKRQAAIEWSKPENIEARRKIEAEEAPKALELGRKMAAKIRAEFNLPDEEPLVPENLPPHMKNQSRSTVLAMLRHEKWRYNRDDRKWELKH